MGASLLFDAITRGHELRHIKPDVEEKISPHEVKADELPPSAEMPPPPFIPDTSDYEDMTQVNLNTVDDFNIPLNFELPQDLWGDSVWGMFGTFAPQY